MHLTLERKSKPYHILTWLLLFAANLAANPMQALNRATKTLTNLFNTSAENILKKIANA